jgi:hypothetical protein
LLQNARPVFNSYLEPQIPMTEAFTLCGVNVRHAMDIERLIRSGLGYYSLQKMKAEAKPLVSSGA